MKKRLTAFFLALALCLSSAVFPAFAGDADDAGRYNDVPEDHWAAESVRRAAELGLFYGDSDGNFGLGQPIGRAAFTAALTRLFGWEEVSPERSTFSDVTPERWFYAAVETAAANGALPASDREFRPTEPITREEMAAMLIRGLGYTSLAGVASTYSSPFADVTTNKGFITLAYELGVIGGMAEDRFQPSGAATREQAAVMLVRVYDLLYAQSVRLVQPASYTPVQIDVPQAQPGDELPATPLEPLPELYLALRQMQSSGADMSRAILRLTAGGVRTITSGTEIVSTETLSAKEVEEILAMDGVNTYYSARYECAYCIYSYSPTEQATVWYQSPEGLAAKLQLARLFGVTRYYMA